MQLAQELTFDMKRRGGCMLIESLFTEGRTRTCAKARPVAQPAASCAGEGGDAVEVHEEDASMIERPSRKRQLGARRVATPCGSPREANGKVKRGLGMRNAQARPSGRPRVRKGIV